MYSRVRARGFEKGWPYHPSTTWGPETPRPRITRPLERWSRVRVAIAVAVGVRAESCTTAVPSLMRDCVGRDIGQGRECVGAPCLGGPQRIVAEGLGFLGDFDQVGGRLSPPVAELEAEFEG